MIVLFHFYAIPINNIKKSMTHNIERIRWYEHSDRCMNIYIWIEYMCVISSDTFHSNTSTSTHFFLLVFLFRSSVAHFWLFSFWFYDHVRQIKPMKGKKYICSTLSAKGDTFSFVRHFSLNFYDRWFGPKKNWHFHCIRYSLFNNFPNEIC